MTSPGQPRDMILLVDDSPEALGFLTEALEQSGFSVLIATSGQAALNIIERVTPDLVLLDAVMPGLDGFETCTRLKANAAVAQVPVIFMTGLTETEHVVRALECGGVDYLSKPINIDELRARLRVHLSNARSAQSARVALDAAGRHLLAVRKDGSIQWSTPQATRLINAATGSNDGLEIVSRTIGSWMETEQSRETPLIVTQAERPSLQFMFLGAVGGDEYLFRLTTVNEKSGEALLRERFALTTRESEVLIWIAKGKSNRDIGEILGLSARTVNKHLEQIYVKLGVENRASAAVKAAHVLHEQ
ncbi:response regulator transcription factor [Agrobacterium larrymoorei]|uniref:response regulator transcription factor n=1 Tax=Agrobacterium larrymoorei TaxID=160699 RepID=UPI001571DE9A|nr:response regulator transcription factor [Agrobacterium larrymoorei]NTJ43114.1 response regulator transcription factor [Agrobacterium larrymoorei]